MNHIIKQQRIEVQIHQKMDSFLIQQKLSDGYWTYILPLLDSIFQNFSSEDQVIMLDSITIDLGNLTLEEISNFQINGKLEELISSQVEVMLLKAKILRNPKELMSLALHHYYQWISYIQKGYLPWNVQNIPEDWQNHVLESISSNIEVLEHFMNELSNQQNSLLRVIRQHSDEFLIRLLKIIAPVYEQLIESKTKDYYKSRNANSPLAQDKILRSREKFWEEIFEEAISLRLNKDQKPLEESLDLISIQNNSTEVEFQDSILEDMVAGELIDLESSLYLSHVGLILIHPFLPSLFRRLDLLQEKAFLNLKLKERAIYLLHYAVTGLQNAKEYELVIPKIICDYPIKRSIPIEADLTISEREEVDAMLEACIANWEILKSTSIEGLRETFLQRPGKVVYNKDKITFQVEKGAVDMLLDYLPWNLNMIKFPWLKQIINVEWR